MTRVRRLPPEVAERIAAGEAVDRPASIVKELVENSLDAQAKFIEVTIEDGGRQLIRVTDDGVGMLEEDAVLCVERHATSKLQAWEDLQSLHSFGFRGEALPSVAAVSRFELVTTARGQQSGTRVTMEGPQSLRSEPAAGPEGTRIDVRDLFWNTPARRKFLKSPTAEGVAISELMTRFAILNPEVGFRLLINGKEKLFFAAGTTQAQRLAQYWKLPEPDLMAIEGEVGEITVSGVVAKPAHHRRNRTAQLIAVNQRIIRSQTLSQAFTEGFDPLVPRGRHPYAFVCLNLDPAGVDVNIHPTKAEVRFADNRAPFRAIYRTIRNCLDEQRVETIKETQWEAALEQSQQPAPAELFDPVPPPAMVTSRSFRESGGRPAQGAPSSPIDRVMEMYRPPEEPAPEEQLPLQAAVKTEPRIRYLSRLYSSYLVMEVDDQLWIVDQHAAHERIGYERLHRFQITGPESQGLMVPLEIPLNSGEQVFLQNHGERFAEVGFEFELQESGPLLMHAVPPGLPAHKVGQFFQELLSEMAADEVSIRQTPVEQYREKLRAMMACKSSIRAREPISEMEALRLLRDLMKAESSPYCPHGRPTRIRLDENILERLFHRS